jgi:hypothetical protein
MPIAALTDAAIIKVNERSMQWRAATENPPCTL